MMPALTVLMAAALASSHPAERKATAPAPGAIVPNFTLKDIHRRPRSLDKYKDQKAFVIVFLGTECPLANLYGPSLIDLHKEYAPKGVQFLAINANLQDAFVHVSAHAQERGVPFPVLKDFDQQVAKSFGARRTPEAFLLDAKRVIRYHGRIDDQYGIGYQREKPTRRDLKEALDELLAGKAITTPQTEVPGCLMTQAREPRVEGEITYSKQVARIVQKHCQECHRPGEIGPFSLLTYEGAKGWAEMIHEVVLEERMPPWHADPRHGKFTNDRRLSREEADTLLAWTKADCPKGDDKDLPPPLPFTKGWKIGQPEAVFRMASEYKVPATGVLGYKKFTVDPGFKEDVWVQAAECRPGNRAVVHHILVYIQAAGRPLYGPDGTASTLVGWAPGDMPALFRKGMAKRIPAGSKFVFEVHYTPNGTEQTDRSSVGIIFAKKPPKREVTTNILANLALRIPPRTANCQGRLDYTFREDALVLGFMPHMHLRGISARYEATYPDGRQETLLSIPDYDFNWQSVYRFAEPLQIPKGTKLAWIGQWDNSADNPRNPDPSKEVRWGLQTWDEMQNGWMELVWAKAEAKAREGKEDRPLALHPDNPHYFLFRGKPTVLITSGEHYGAVLNRDFDYVRYLDELQANHLNHTRTFAGTYREIPGSFKITDNTLAPAPGRYLCPWSRSATPGHFDGGNKFDLTKWDDEYFRRLKDFMTQAAKRGIVVELNLFCPNYDDALWKANPMNTANNVNDVGKCPASEVYTLKHKDLVAVQEAVTRKIVQELRDFDNLYYEVCNEPYFGGVTQEWQNRIADVIADAEKALPHKHLISMNIANGRAKVSKPHPAVSIFNFHYCVPPDVVAMNYGLNKPIGENETGFRGNKDVTYRTEGWDFLLAGGALYNNLDYSFTCKRPDGTFLDYKSPGGGSPELRRQLKALKDFMDSFDFVRMAPNNAIIKGGVPKEATARALVEPGKQYALYVRGGNQAELQLEIPAGTYTVEWLDTKTGKVAASEQRPHGGGIGTFRSPAYHEDTALRIRVVP